MHMRERAAAQAQRADADAADGAIARSACHARRVAHILFMR